MKFSYRWLRDLVPSLQTDPRDLERLITMKTAECESAEPYGGHFSQVRAVRVVSVEPLAKGKNKLVLIETSEGQRRVVCGAPNVAPDMLAPWVPPGTSLGGKVIGRLVVDGVESDGMLASGAELGINRDGEGLLDLSGAKVGQRLDGLEPDVIIEIDNKSLTHRPDLWGHIGLAREVAAITNARMIDPIDTSLLPAGESPSVAVRVEDAKLCPRYSALLIENVQVAASPLWLQARLESVGLNPINNLVDVTNFIVAELPQPMHAFDADKIKGGITVRLAAPGEKIDALNGESYELMTSDLVIADEAGPIAIAGVIGGTATAISATTTRVILESANFHASCVRLTSARLKLRTDASVRFEKSLDPENTIGGLARAIQLIRGMCPGMRVIGGLADARSISPALPPIELPVKFVQRRLGKDVSAEEITGILEALGFSVGITAPGLLTVSVPTWRATKDVSMKQDLVEEIGRMIGYGSITPVAPLIACVPPPMNPMRSYLRDLRSGLAAQGFTEVHNYSFVNQSELERFRMDASGLIAVRNPIASELTHLRRSLLPGLFKNAVSNVRHSQEFRIFEIGKEIHPASDGELPLEITHAAGLLYSAHADEQDFFEGKRVIECLFPASRLQAAEARSFEHPTRTAEILWHASTIGRVFELHPSLLQAEGLDGRAVIFDVNLETALTVHSGLAVRYKQVRKYPTSGFDLSVLAELREPVAQIEESLSRFGAAELTSLDFVRQYAGPPLPEGRKSVSYHLEVGATDHTLSTEEVASIRTRIIDGMREQGYELRI